MNNASNSRSDSTLTSSSRPLAVVFGLATAILVVVFDIIIKQYITTILLNDRGPIEVTQFFNLVLGFNRGVSFGLLSSESAWAPWALSAVAVLIAAWLAFRLL